MAGGHDGAVEAGDEVGDHYAGEESPEAGWGDAGEVGGGGGGGGGG